VNAKDFIPLAGQRNHFTHPTLGVCALRAGQTPEEFVSEMAAAEARAMHGLLPGRTMPSVEEIAAGPVEPPSPPPDPRDVKIEALEAAVAALKTADVLTDAMIDAERVDVAPIVKL